VRSGEVLRATRLDENAAMVRIQVIVLAVVTVH
jgi:hypothetical protein